MTQTLLLRILVNAAVISSIYAATVISATCDNCVGQGCIYCKGDDFFGEPSVCVCGDDFDGSFGSCSGYSFGSDALTSKLDCTFGRENGEFILAVIIIVPTVVLCACICCFCLIRKNQNRSSFTPSASSPYAVTATTTMPSQNVGYGATAPNVGGAPVSIPAMKTSATAQAIPAGNPPPFVPTPVPVAVATLASPAVTPSAPPLSSAVGTQGGTTSNLDSVYQQMMRDLENQANSNATR